MNAYQTLGLLPGAKPVDIKRAYRKLAQQYHPDKNKDPGAEKKFVLIKEAYEYLVSGKSNSGIFDELKKTAPKPKPKPKNDDTFGSAPNGWWGKPDVKHVDKIKLLVSFSDAFTGASVPVPNTPFVIKIRPGTQNGFIERRLCRSAAGFESYLDIEYRLYDPIGFYKLQIIDGVLRFCCHLEMTSGQVLGEFEHTLKNVDPSKGPVIVKVPVNHGTSIRIPNAGIRMDEAGRRSDLYVIPVVRFTPIEKEIQPVLVAMNKRVQDALKAYNYFK